MKTILAYGEVLWDILPTETMLGGAVCNFIYRVIALGDRGIIVSRLGRDGLGEKAFETVASLGIDTSYLQWDDKHPTGTVPVTFDENSNPSFLIVPNVAYDYIEMTESLRQIAPSIDCLCFGTLSQRSPKTQETLKQLIDLAENALKLLDINLRKDCYNFDIISYSLQNADVLKLNEDELYEIGKMFDLQGDAIPQVCEGMMKKWPLKYCVVTLGEKGAYGISDRGEKVYDPGYRIDLVDPIGSGDAFTAGFAYCILRDMPLAEACELGNIMGALVATQKGASSTLAQDEIDNFRDRDLDRIYDMNLSNEHEFDLRNSSYYRIEYRYLTLSVGFLLLSNSSMFF